MEKLSFHTIIYRIVWVGVVRFLDYLKLYGWRKIKGSFRKNKNILKFIVTGVIINCNWSIYIWVANLGPIVLYR